MIRPIKILSLALTLAFVPLFALAGAKTQESVSELVESLTRNRDESDPELITQLANHRNQEAVDGLIKVYDSMGSNYMRREVLRALELFDGVAAGQQDALQKMMDVATDAPDREVRWMALESISRCRTLGKAFLENVVESPAEDEVREQAMEYHIEMASQEDNEWYRKLYDPELAKKSEKDQKKKGNKKKPKKGEEEEQVLMVHSLPEIRALAFEQLAESMKVQELIEATDDKYWDIRRRALLKLNQKDPKKVLQMAEDSVGSVTRQGTERVACAKIIVEAKGVKAASKLIDIAGKDPSVTPSELRYAIADLLAGLNDESLNKKLTKLVGKGKGYEKLFAIRANVNNTDEKVTKALRKGIKDKDRDVKVASIQALGERKDTDSLKELTKAMAKVKKDKEILAVYLAAIGNIKGNDAEFEAELVGYLTHEERDMRNCALELLAKMDGQKHLDHIKAALANDQWDTRFTALKCLEEMRTKEAIGLIIQRMPEEDGRMLHEFSRTLFRLTGQPYGKAHGGWRAWWDKEGKDLDPISESQLKKRIKEEETRRLKQRSKASFFGIKIISKRVVFIIDVSGSMNEMMRTRYVDEKTGETRMTVAQRELKKSIDGLERGALFNIITFESGVTLWLDEGVAGSEEKSRDDAKEYVDKLGAGGATNLYGAVKAAFQDDQVDAIYILSDGEPTAGEQQDPQAIRDHVQLWNEHRGIEIHCVAVGGSLQALEWLAEDSGGTYVKFN